MNKHRSPADVLTEARRLLDAGWHKGANTDGDHNYCIRAAIGLASGSMIEHDGQVTYDYQTEYNLDQAVEYLAALRSDNLATAAVIHALPTPYRSIIVFNDDPDTTKDDVLAVLDKAIKSC